jgi:hypothetical protein
MKQQYVICIKNKGYDASLECRKLYEYIPDKKAEEHGQIRIIDESGEDYVYPKGYFMKMQIPKAVEEALSRAA